MKKSILLCFALYLSTAAAIAAQQQSDDQEDDSDKILTKRIVVSAKRLPDDPKSRTKVPANIIVITRQDIESSGARSVQEVLSYYANTINYDNVGNGIQTTIGMRGFSGGNAVAFYLDGVRINQPDDNRVNLEFIDVRTVERIEIVPGSGSGIRGNGVTAGSINIYSRSGDQQMFNELGGSYGSYKSYDASVRSGSIVGIHSYFFGINYARSDGFRDYGDSDQRSLATTYRYDDPGSDSLVVTYHYYKGKMGNPGALTPEELAANRDQNLFNQPDFTNSEEQVITSQYGIYLSDSIKASLLGYRRQSNIEVLTTGRSAAIFGGFNTVSDNVSHGLTGQLSFEQPENSLLPELTFGFELSRDDFTNVGYFTDAGGEQTFQANDRDTTQDNLAYFLQGSMTLANLLTVSGDIRKDKVKMDFTDNSDARQAASEFSETTGAFGATLELLDWLSFYGRFSQSFQTPTVNDLFAFPLFGSNPDLQPTTGETVEGGVNFSLPGDWFVQAALYRMNLENEVVFVLTDPARFIGRNENIGESRRTGFEAFIYNQPSDWFVLRSSVSYVKAENLSLGEQLGGTLEMPLVPKFKFGTFGQLIMGDYRIGLEHIYVSSQFLSNDNENVGEKMAGYNLLNLRLGWETDVLRLTLEVRNLLDEEYSTRGIFSTGQSYFTPAPGRQYRASLELHY